MSTFKIIKPYYKYKQEAYNSLNQLVKSLLDEFGFYQEFPQFKNTDIVAYFDESSRSGAVSFRLANSSLWLFTLEPSFHVEKNYFLVGRDKLTIDEAMAISRYVKAFFKTGSNSTVVKKLNGVIIYFHASKEECFFRTVNGATYINRD